MSTVEKPHQARALKMADVVGEQLAGDAKPHRDLFGWCGDAGVSLYLVCAGPDVIPHLSAGCALPISHHSILSDGAKNVQKTTNFLCQWQRMWYCCSAPSGMPVGGFSSRLSPDCVNPLACDLIRHLRGVFDFTSLLPSLLGAHRALCTN